MGHRRFRIFALAGLLAGWAQFSYGGEDVLARLGQSRHSLKPFHAVYVETDQVREQPVPEPGMHLGYGSFSGQMEVSASIDSEGSDLIYKRMIPAEDAKDPNKLLGSGGTHIFHNDGDVAYNLIEGGSRGDFGHHPTGMTNPAAAGYEVRGGIPLEKFLRGVDYRVLDDTTIECSHGKSKITLHVANLAGQEAVASVEAVSENRVATQTVTDWIEYQGSHYPKTVEYTLDVDGRNDLKRTWALKEIIRDNTPLKPPIIEGALLKDSDTNLMYDFRGGKLVSNPMFNRETGIAVTLRRVGFVAAALLLFASLWFWRMRRRPRRLPQFDSQSSSPTKAV